MKHYKGVIKSICLAKKRPKKCNLRECGPECFTCQHGETKLIDLEGKILNIKHKEYEDGR
jgi:hypothetical protein